MSLQALKAYAKKQYKTSSKKPANKAKLKPNMKNNKILTLHAEREKRITELYKEIADNTVKSEYLRRKINKDVKAGESIYNILDDAIKCISLMTHDKLFYTQNIENLRKYNR